MPRRALTVVSGGNGHDPHTPTAESRRLVVLGTLNNLSLDRIAALVGISRADLKRHYRNEIDNGTDLALIEASNNMLWLAHQRADLGVSLRANQALLGPRVRSWREAAPAPSTSESDINDMNLAEIDAEIARLERDMAAAKGTAGEAGNQ
ncbi:hypothetical protein ACD578_10560 [Microvirga sp. RSM25]|uniref:hypothetical protein n=1 Tax=Microvirga sp. RSM25 TaxID=3273802 RepID=UPI00385082BF